jgi:spoIIIJ-associated protein
VKEIEVNGKTVDEAIHAALQQLGVGQEQVEIVIVKKGRSGVLGMGVEDARVKVSLIEKRPENIGEIAGEAKAVLENLLRCMGIKGKVVLQASDNGLPLTLDIEGDDLGVLIGRRGQGLASLQYIVRVIIAEKFKVWEPINIDVAGYKRRRYESLKSLALRLADQVKSSKRSINLEPMPPDERRIIHLALSDHPEISTQSTGEGNERKVVIQLRKH